MMNEKFELPFQFKDAYNKLFKRITISLLNSLLSILLTILLFANDVINKQTPLFGRCTGDEASLGIVEHDTH